MRGLGLRLAAVCGLACCGLSLRLAALGLSPAAVARDGLKLADEIVAVLATIDREDARRLIKLVRDLLDTVERAIEREK